MTNSTAYYLSQFHGGDDQAIEALLERHLDWILAHVRRRLGAKLRGKAESVDFVQDAVIEFLRYAPRFQTDDDHCFRGLLVRIVENCLRDKHDWFTAQRRNIACERPLPGDSLLNLDGWKNGSETPSQIAMQGEREAWIRLGMELLDPDDRELIVLRDWQQLSFPEIGEQLDTSPEAARKRYGRAVERLATKVQELRTGALVSEEL